MIVVGLVRWLLLLAAVVTLGVLLDRFLIWLDAQGVIRYRGGRARDRDERTGRHVGRGHAGRTPEGFPDDPFPPLDLDDEEDDDEPPDNVYPFH